MVLGKSKLVQSIFHSKTIAEACSPPLMAYMDTVCDSIIGKCRVIPAAWADAKMQEYVEYNNSRMPIVVNRISNTTRRIPGVKHWGLEAVGGPRVGWAPAVNGRF